MAPSAGSFGFDWTILTLFCAAALGCAGYYGGSVFWTSAPFIALAMAGSAAVQTRYLLMGCREGLKIPPGSLLVLLLSLYVLVRALIVPVVPYQIWTELYQILAFFLLYLGLTEVADRPRVWLWGLNAFLLFAAAEALYALVQHVNDSTLVLWLERPAQYGMRASGSFICPNHFAQILQLAVVVAVGLFLIPGVTFVPRLFAGFFLLVGLPGLVLSGSRSGWIGTVAGLGALFLLRSLRRGWKKVLLTVMAFFASVSLISVLMYTQVESVKLRVDLACRGGLADADIRTSQLWPDTLLLIDAAGAGGSGPGTFRHVFARYRENFDQATLYLRYAHNEYLHTLAEYGWVAWVLFAGVFALGIRMVVRALQARSETSAMVWASWFSVLFATAVHAAFDFNAHLPGNMFVLALVSAMFAARLYQLGTLSPYGGFPPACVRTVLGIGLACSLLLVGVSFPLYRASRIQYAIEVAEFRQKPAERLRHGHALREAMPFHWLGYRIVAEDRQAAALWCRDEGKRVDLVRESRVGYETALRWNPYDLPSRMGLVRLLRLQGDFEAALEQIPALSEMDPLNQGVFIEWGLVLKNMGRLEEALEAFTEAARLRPGNQQVNLNMNDLRKRITQQENEPPEVP